MEGFGVFYVKFFFLDFMVYLIFYVDRMVGIIFLVFGGMWVLVL